MNTMLNNLVFSEREKRRRKEEKREEEEGEERRGGRGERRKKEERGNLAVVVQYMAFVNNANWDVAQKHLIHIHLCDSQ
jgi:hypothetical protein